MRELTKAMFSWTWAMSVFGVHQVVDVANGVVGSKDAADKAAQRFDNVAAAASAEVGQSMRAALDTGNNMQRGMVDLFFSGIGMLDPQRWSKMASGMGCQPCGGSAQTGSPASPPPPPANPAAGPSNPFARPMPPR